MPVLEANAEHEVAYLDLCKLVNKHADKISALELLAIAANMVGKLIAMQDQRTVTPSQAMEIVVKNIEYGNQQLMERLDKSEGSA
jgi:hypothetical protein